LFEGINLSKVVVKCCNSFNDLANGIVQIMPLIVLKSSLDEFVHVCCKQCFFNDAFSLKFDLKNMVSSFDLYIGFHMEEMALIFTKLQGKKSKQQNFRFGILQFEFSYLLYMKFLTTKCN
jgi:hypothetical protein